MLELFNCSRFLRFLVLFAASTGTFALAQSSSKSLITQPIDDRVRLTLNGNVHTLAQARFDQGAVSDSYPAARMFLILQRPPEREAALLQFLQDAHTPGNSSFHKWLSPQQFGALFGPDDSDVATITAWLQSHGFSVARVTKGKTAIEFSGNAGEVRNTFKTEIHTYVVNGETHHANNRDPQIPSALAQVIAGISPLNDFRPKSYMEVLGHALYAPKTHKLIPQWTLPSSGPVLALAPGDFAVQYDLNPLYNAGINGAGVTIGIIGASNVDPVTFANYRSLFALPSGTLNVVLDGVDPGVGNWATGESDLDVEVAGAVAPGATINLYTASDTSVQSGLLLAAQRAVDDDQASVLSTSYGSCEQELGSAGNQFWAGLWEQAAAQGQTSFVSAGDGGSAGCDDFDDSAPAQFGLAVSGFTSTPWNISVGGTDFFYSSYNSTSSAQMTQLANYWNLTPASQPVTSLLQPVPEQPWNRAFGLNLSSGGAYNPEYPTIVAGSGGASSCVTGVAAADGTFSSCVAGYPKPLWQSGTGVPADNVRDVPDVSLFAAPGENDSFYPVCLGPVECTVLADGNVEIAALGGTSASSPAMAGIMALINQKYGPQGQANFVLYPLAAQRPTVFHDVAIGSNVVPCVKSSSPSCVLSTLADNTEGFYTLGHYYATPGYDQATGLGSVDANLLFNSWNSLSFKSSSTTLGLSQTAFTHGTSVTINVAVSGTGGTPSGDVGLVTTAAAASNTSMGELTLQGGSASATLNNLPGGQYQLTAKYTGNTVFGPSNSSPITLNVAAEQTNVSVYGTMWNMSANAFTPITSGASYPYGTFMALDAQPLGLHSPQGSSDGIPTGTISLTDSVSGAASYSGPLPINRKAIVEWVPSQTLPVGSHSVSASYSGDASFSASTSSAPFTFNIVPAQTSAFLVAKPSTIALGSNLFLTVELSLPYSGPQPAPPASTFPNSSPVTPSGTVTFYFGTTVLGTSTVLADLAGTGPGTAVLNFAGLPLGTDSITAVYSGDSNYAPVTSNAFNVVVLETTTLTAAANPASVNQGEFTAITATVAGVSGMTAPTGTVTFTAVGPASTITDTEPVNNGSATSVSIPGGLFIPGTASVDVAYSGDSVYGPNDIGVSFAVTPGNLPPFSISSTPVDIATPGATTANTSTVALTPENGFTGTVFLACSLISSPIGASDLPGCNIPASISLTGTAPVNATMTVTSTAPTSAAIPEPFRNWPVPRGPGWLASRLAITFAALLVALLPLAILLQRRRPYRFAGFLFVLVFLGSLAGTLAGCASGGSGGGGSSTPPPSNPGTTPGNYVFTVQAAFSANGATQAQTTVTVTVQ